MRRVLKEHDERKNELLHAAWELFCERGYEATAVTEILERVGVAKGTFYHYFASKEEVLDAAIEHFTIHTLKELEQALRDPSLSALEKLNRFMIHGRDWKIAHAGALRGITDFLMRPENIVLWHKMGARAVALTAPFLERIIEQGVAEGVFDTRHPRESAELLIALGRVLAEQNRRELEGHGDRERGAARMRLRFETALDAMERILGAPRGSLVRPDREFTEAMTGPGEVAAKKERT